MIHRKKKCKECNEEQLLYARGMCKPCDRKVTPEKHGQKPLDYMLNATKKKGNRIKPISDTMAKKLKEYRPLRDEYMKSHPVCEVEGCNKPSQDLHHKQSRRTHLCDTSVFMAVCRSCHNWIGDNHAEAVKLGYVIQNIEKSK